MVSAVVLYAIEIIAVSSQPRRECLTAAGRLRGAGGRFEPQRLLRVTFKSIVSARLLIDAGLVRGFGFLQEESRFLVFKASRVVILS